MAYQPIDYQFTPLSVDTGDFKAPEYSKSNLESIMDNMKDAAQPELAQALSGLSSRFAGSTLGRGSQRQYGASNIYSNYAANLAKQRGDLNRQALGANQQERQFQQGRQDTTSRYNSSQQTIIDGMKDRSNQFQATLLSNESMSDADRAQALQIFNTQMSMQAAKMGLDRDIAMAELTGNVGLGSVTGDATDGYTYKAFEGDTSRSLAAEGQDWSKFSSLAQLIRSGALGADAGSALGPDSYQDTLAGIKPEDSSAKAMSDKYGFSNPYEMSFYQAMDPYKFKSYFNHMTSSDPWSDVGYDAKKYFGANWGAA